MLAFLFIPLGAILVGIGLILYFRGKAYMRSEQTKDIGKQSYTCSLIWLGLGGLLFLCPIIIWIVLGC